MPNPRVLFLMGPTASGKTDVAMALCDRLPAEIISVDSALVYRGLDIGSAKPDAETLTRYPHHLVDICDPAQPYSAAQFAQDASELIVDIVARGKLPILVGGTMLYFKVLRDGIAELPQPNQSLREQMAIRADSEGWPVLHAELARVDPATAEKLHPNHSQRIQRALEVYQLTGIPLSQWHRQQAQVSGFTQQYEVHQVALMPRNRMTLHQRIERRFERMLQMGFEEEVRDLMARGDLHLDLPSMRAVGYRQMWEYLAGEYDFASMREKGVAATRQLAKRQFTWLRRWESLNSVYTEDAQGTTLSFSDLADRVYPQLLDGR